MLDKIAELDYSGNQLRELNAEMRHWLDVADDDMAVLRSENANLRKQVKDLEKSLSGLQQVEVEPCGPLLADGLDEKQIFEKRIQDLEKETIKVQEENKELTAKFGTALENACSTPKKTVCSARPVPHARCCNNQLAWYDLSITYTFAIGYGGLLSPKRCTFSAVGLDRGPVCIQTISKPHQSPFGSGPRPPQKVGLGPVVWSGPGFT
ncbi:hypothetical protein ATANTOWER_029477 [Ataeniobius toweri]|uniref:Uncharacterized protein n=1 Tax=Ataeniobius toweri TaxID=208326 RepID=A0ABU7C2R9_9TELE|nr:hypothetical protein [Ataeniobius toweri]